MSTHIYSSRGRTKQPKNIARPHGSGLADHKTNGKVAVLPSGSALHETLESTTAGANGYDTQNQKYLHICMSQSTAHARSVDIYAYNRQFGTWGKLKVPVGEGATVDAAWVDAKIISDASAVTYQVIPIYGIDRVAFAASTGAGVGGLSLYVAGSTF